MHHRSLVRANRTVAVLPMCSVVAVTWSASGLRMVHVRRRWDDRCYDVNKEKWKEESGGKWKEVDERWKEVEERWKEVKERWKEVKEKWKEVQERWKDVKEKWKKVQENTEGSGGKMKGMKGSLGKWKEAKVRWAKVEENTRK